MTSDSVTNVRIAFPDNAEELAKRITNILQLAINYGMSPTVDEKQWVLDQIVHSILEEDYPVFVQSYNSYASQDQDFWSSGQIPKEKARQIGTVTFRKPRGM